VPPLNKYNIYAWKKIADGLISATASPLTLAVFTATCTEMPDGTASIVAHCDGYGMAMREMANALYRTYGDGAFDDAAPAIDPADLPACVAHLN
jgi:hypothetical protein